MSEVQQQIPWKLFLIYALSGRHLQSRSLFTNKGMCILKLLLTTLKESLRKWPETFQTTLSYSPSSEIVLYFHSKKSTFWRENPKFYCLERHKCLYEIIKIIVIAIDSTQRFWHLAEIQLTHFCGEIAHLIWNSKIAVSIHDWACRYLW